MDNRQSLAERKPQPPAPRRRDGSKQTSLIIGGFDRPFLILVILLASIGSIMMFSASYSFAETNFGNSLYFASRQLMWITLGFVVLAAATHFVTATLLRRTAVVCYLVVLGLNILVPIIGFATHGATRQIDLGFVSFQPSELLKTFNVIICAHLIAQWPDKMKTMKYGVLPFALLGVFSAVVCIAQSHLSATIINLLIILFMMLMGGSNGIVVGSVGGVGAAAVLYAINNVDKLLELTIIKEKLSHVYLRLLVWKNPFEYMRNAELGDPGWQPSQSLYAVSSGGVWGLGLGKSIEKHGYLPEPQNDYVFAIVCEELGFAGAVTIICLFALLVIRGFQIAKRCRDKFSMLVVMGLTVKVALQVILNIAVVTNTIPSTGISLPFFSYGGTALLILMAEMGIILAISKVSYLEKE